MIGVAGCVAQAEGEEILRRAPAVDVVIGPQTYHRLPQALRRARAGERVIETEYAVEDKFEHLPPTEKKVIRSRGVTAFLTVQEGCDKFCTFCVVPYTRGSEVSRPLQQIIDEATRLAESGVREVTLLGQNVNAWHGTGPKGESWGLGDLLYRLGGVPGSRGCAIPPAIRAIWTIASLRPPRSSPVDAVSASAGSGGSDRILKAMNRRHTADEYIRLIERIRGVRPDIALSGDFIVGFPGETDEDFEATMRLIETVNYAQAFSFKYSVRPGTPGAELGFHVAEEVKVNGSKGCRPCF